MEKQTFTNRQILGISIAFSFIWPFFIAGLIDKLLYLLVYFEIIPFDISLLPYEVWCSIPGALLFSILGAFAGKSWRKTPLAIVVGAMLGATFGTISVSILSSETLFSFIVP